MEEKDIVNLELYAIAYKKAEQLSDDVIQMLAQKNVTILEMQKLKTVLPQAIERKINECESKLNLF